MQGWIAATRIAVLTFVVSGGLSCGEALESAGRQSSANGIEPVSRDIGVAPGEFPPEGMRLIHPETSVGRFPSGVAIARVEVVECADAPRRQLRVVGMRDTESACWNHLLDDLPQVREVVVMSRYGLPLNGARVHDLLRESTKLGCRLCLVYVQSGDAATDTELMGSLWDAEGRRALAAYRTGARVELEDGHRCKSQGGEDHRQCRAEYVATRELERLVRESIWTLADMDQPVATTQPNPWESERPGMPWFYLQGREIYIRP